MTASDHAPAAARLAFDCSAALDRGDKTSAKQLAEEGLALATRTGDAKWARRFEHLLRVATDQSIEYRGPAIELSCFFCLTPASRVNITVGGGAIICDNCVKRCLANRLDGSGIERTAGDDVTCSFCHRQSDGALFSARGYHICEQCIQRIPHM